MTIKEAWRVERERGMPAADDYRAKEASKVPSLGTILGSIIGVALVFTALGVVAKLIALTWRWILAP